MKKLFLISAICLFACASTYPIKDFQSKLWKPNVEEQKAQHFNEDTGQIEEIDFKDTKLEEDLIMISPEDFVRELKYQKLLIKSCKEWR